MFKRNDHAVVHRLATACRAGSAGAIRSLLAPEVVAIADGGGRVPTAASTARGPVQVTRCLTELLRPDVVLTVEAVNGRPGVVLRTSDSVVAVLSLNVTGPKVTTVWIVLNPDKLRHWHSRE